MLESTTKPQRNQPESNCKALLKILQSLTNLGIWMPMGNCYASVNATNHAYGITYPSN